MPKGDPLDRFFYPTLTLMMDSYMQLGIHNFFAEAKSMRGFSMRRFFEHPKQM